MRIGDARVEDGRLVLESGGWEFSLADGVYRSLSGDSFTIEGSRITAALIPIDVARATPPELVEYVNAVGVELATVGDDAQLANLDLQNALQKQQQLLQTMSSVSKKLHDTAMATIRKIG